MPLVLGEVTEICKPNDGVRHAIRFRKAMDFPGLPLYLSRMKFPAALLCLLVVGVMSAPTARAIVNGQLDTFEDGTSEFWVNGFGNLAVAVGGPGGAGDHYLEIGGLGFPGPSSKLVGYNASQWTGNFIAAGVNAVEMDLKAISIDPISGISTLTIRIAFRSATGQLTSKGASGYVSSVGATIPVDGQWHHVVFPLSSLVPINSTNDGMPPAPLATFLTGPAEFRIMHLVSPNALIGDNVKAVLGIDNIHAFQNVSILSTTRLSASTVRLQGKGVANTIYTIQASPDLVQSFAAIGTAVSAADGTFQFDDANASTFTQRFYRVKTP